MDVWKCVSVIKPVIGTLTTSFLYFRMIHSWSPSYTVRTRRCQRLAKYLVYMLWMPSLVLLGIEQTSKDSLAMPVLDMATVLHSFPSSKPSSRACFMI